jgi:ribosomal protein S17E
MIPAKEKAKELIDSFEDLVLYDYRHDDRPIFEYQKKSALIVCNQILSYLDKNKERILDCFGWDYWQEVKEEIEKFQIK